MSFRLGHKRSTKQKHELPPLLIKLDLWDVLQTYRKVGSRNPLLVIVCLYDLQVRSNKFNLSKLSQCFFTTPRGTRLSSEPFLNHYCYTSDFVTKWNLTVSPVHLSMRASELRSRRWYYHEFENLDDDLIGIFRG